MALWTAADGGGVGGMWTPAYPGELPENRENTNSVPPGGGEDWNPADTFNWFYGNGQFHISEDHELDELSSHAGVREDHTGPVAMGEVHVDMGKATWTMHGNVSAHGISRILKDYTDTAGWQWGGMTDVTGEPVDTGSEFAPKKSYYFSYDGKEAKLARTKSRLEFCSGAVHIGGKEGFLYTQDDRAMDALAEWASDTGIVLVADFNRPMMQSMNPQVPPDREDLRVRFQPWTEGNRGKGVKVDGQWYAWNVDETEYPHHDHGDMAVKGTLYSDWTYIHPDGQMTKIHGGWVAPMDQSDFDWKTSGNDTGLKTMEDYELDNNGGMFQNPDEHMLESPPDERLPGGVFKCPACSRIFPNWGLYLRHRTKEEPMGENHDDPTKDTAWLDMDATFPPHYHDMPSFHEAMAADPDWINQWVRENGPYLYHGIGNAEFHYGLKPEETINRIKNEGLKPHMKPQSPKPEDYDDVDAMDAFMDWPRPGHVFMTTSPETTYGNHVFRVDLRKLDPANLNPDDDWMRDKFGGPGVGEGINEYGLGGYADKINLGQNPEDTHSSFDYGVVAHNGPIPPHALEYMGQKTAASAPEGKDLVAGPIPFIYDIQEDSITVGQPGTRQSDIPGQFTPGGIVEGTYEPGGSVQIRSMTNMPYTVRHMLELWYYNYPHMEVKSVELTDDSGKQTKLAGQDVGGYVKTLMAAHPTTFHAWKALEAAGGRVFVVGGAVRDALLGKEPHDFDLMVTGMPEEEISKVLNNLVIQDRKRRSVDVTGKAFGVFRYKEGPYDEVEIALPRTEHSTGEGHKDFAVKADHNMTPEEDLYRRDFTINAMAIDLSSGQLIDPFGGLADTQNRTLRTLHTKSLADDPLRTLRALTAVAKHGLIPTSETEAQMEENGPGLASLPNDRIKSELDKMFGYDDLGKHKDVDTAKAMRLAMDTNLMKYMFPEVEATRDYDQKNPHHEQLLDQHLLSVLEHTQKLAPHDPDLKLAALLHDIGKPPSRWSECRQCFHPHPGEVHVCEACGSDDVSGHFYQKAPGIGGTHETLGAEMAAARMKELRYPNARIAPVSALIMHHMFPGFNTEKGARRFLNKTGDLSDRLLTLRQADQGGKSIYPTDATMSVDDHRDLINKVRAGNAPTAMSQLAVNGRDLLAAGVPQGPEIGQTLQYLQEQVLENPQLNTKEALLGLVRAKTASSFDDEVTWNSDIESLAEYTERKQEEERQKSADREFPITHPEGHRINWTPGQFGKGTRGPDGAWHAYNVGDEPDGGYAHDYYEKHIMGYTGQDYIHSPHSDYDERRFHVYPNGFLAYYGSYTGGYPFRNASEVMPLHPEFNVDPEKGNSIYKDFNEGRDEDDWSSS